MLAADRDAPDDGRVEALKLDPGDTIAVAITPIQAGDVVTVMGSDEQVTARVDIPSGHKIALQAIASGEDVLRYGEVIGAATADIERGDHVHVHNLISKRIPGR